MGSARAHRVGFTAVWTDVMGCGGGGGCSIIDGIITLPGRPRCGSDRRGEKDGGGRGRGCHPKRGDSKKIHRRCRGALQERCWDRGSGRGCDAVEYVARAVSQIIPEK
ncbi:hypothetical protein QC764_300140 [Podospora pseudoanserina]|uniref:Uncharacterized protein n=1 Tax=Podospora pseudoanserina TaxID=2609844 RepID=A0ABR0IBQ7_9PEZI|nr:hypothetical protein QC764_300140 [Podospora pseudoanserina]